MADQKIFASGKGGKGSLELMYLGMILSTPMLRAVIMGTTASFLLNEPNSSYAQAVGVEVEPVMKLNGSEIVACGLAMLLKHPNRDFRAFLVNEKEEAGVRTVLRASTQQTARATDNNINTPLVSASVTTTDISTVEILTLQRDGDERQFEASARLSSSDVAKLFQQLLVSGAVISMRTSKETYEWRLQGPASQSVRAAYLMCSGDLYRP